MKDLNKIFYPESIALIGATEKFLKWGSYIILNILNNKYKGRFYPVTHSRDSVYGVKAYKSILDINDTIDLAIISTPASTVMDVLSDCVKKNIHNVVIITSGFNETGKEGARLEERLIAYARENDLNIVGPNTMGIINTWADLYAMGSQAQPRKGGISIIAQSGNVGNQIMAWAEQRDIGVSKFVGSGNESILNCVDYLEYLYEDDATSVILLYIEGIDDGRKFLEVAGKTTLKKPIIALKGGRTELGGKAAASHTGSMAGSYKIFENAMKQCGIVLAKNPTELLILASAFDSLPLPRGNRIGVLTAGGGWGVITADECEERNIKIPPLPPEILKEIDSYFPPYWSKSNPVDFVGSPDIASVFKSLTSIISSDSFDAVVYLGVVGSTNLVEKTYKAAHNLGVLEDFNKVKSALDNFNINHLNDLIDLVEKNNKPIYAVALIVDREKLLHRKEGSKYDMVIFRSPEDAVLCLARQYEYFRYLQKQEKSGEKNIK